MDIPDVAAPDTEGGHQHMKARTRLRILREQLPNRWAACPVERRARVLVGILSIMASRPTWDARCCVEFAMTGGGGDLRTKKQWERAGRTVRDEQRQHVRVSSFESRGREVLWQVFDVSQTEGLDVEPLAKYAARPGSSPVVDVHVALLHNAPMSPVADALCHLASLRYGAQVCDDNDGDGDQYLELWDTDVDTFCLGLTDLSKAWAAWVRGRTKCRLLLAACKRINGIQIAA